MKKMMMTLALTLISCWAQASGVLVPTYSISTRQDGIRVCTHRASTNYNLGPGRIVGLPLQLHNLGQLENMYIAICARPDKRGGTALVPTFSPVSHEEARNVCELRSSSIYGFGPGRVVGLPLEGHNLGVVDNLYLAICAR